MVDFSRWSGTHLADAVEWEFAQPSIVASGKRLSIDGRESPREFFYADVAGCVVRVVHGLRDA